MNQIKDIHYQHKKHRNVLYSLVILLTIISIVSFSLLTIQISKLDTKLNSEIQKSTSESKQYSETLVKTYDTLYQENFREISSLLSEQKKGFDQEIKLLKSSQSDFSAVVEKAVKSVVTVSAGN